MPIIKPVNGKAPQIKEDCYIAENATIVGDVHIGKQCSIWFNAVLRGDVHYIKLGNKVNVQDGLFSSSSNNASIANAGFPMFGFNN